MLQGSVAQQTLVTSIVASELPGVAIESKLLSTEGAEVGGDSHLFQNFRCKVSCNAGLSSQLGTSLLGNRRTFLAASLFSFLSTPTFTLHPQLAPLV